MRRRERVVDVDGVAGRLLGVAIDDSHTPIARIRLARGELELPFELLEHDEHGSYRVRGRWRDYTVRAQDGTTSIPVIEERVKVDVRPAPERRMRIRRRVVTEAKEVEVPLREDRIDVQRVPVGAFVDRMPEPREEGDVLVIPVVEEVAVVEKRLRVVEELRVRVIRDRRVHRETVPVSRHDVEIEHEQEPHPKHPLTRRGD
jgi:stress response protein YsnF